MGVLRFRLFRFPVEIQPGFWLLALIIGFRPGHPISEAFIWLGVIFFSVLVHELGHAFVARAYGQSPSIALHMLGGVTSWSATHDIGRGRRILVTLAGPGAGFALGVVAVVGLFAVVLSVDKSLPHPPWFEALMLALGQGHAQYPAWVAALSLLAFANMFWSAINLMPVLPFDGGQVLLTALGPERRKLAASVSLIFGVITAIVLFRLGSILGAILFGLGGVSNFIAAMQSQKPSKIPPEAAEKILVEARRALDDGDGNRAASLAGAVLEVSQDHAARKQALELLAWAALASGNVAAARDALRELPMPRDAYLEAAVAEADGDLPRASRLLGAARAEGDLRPEVAAMLVRVLLRTGQADQAVEVAIAISDQASDEELARVAAEAEGQGAIAAAAKLRERIADRARSEEQLSGGT